MRRVFTHSKTQQSTQIRLLSTGQASLIIRIALSPQCKHSVRWLLPNYFSAEPLEPSCVFCGEIGAEEEMRNRVNIWMGLGEDSRQQRKHFHMWLHHTVALFRAGCQMSYAMQHSICGGATILMECGLEFSKIPSIQRGIVF